jgi:hypothetical protein
MFGTRYVELRFIEYEELMNQFICTKESNQLSQGYTTIYTSYFVSNKKGLQSVEDLIKRVINDSTGPDDYVP